jgi:hypothetical protein
MAREYLQISENDRYVLNILPNIAKHQFALGSIYSYYLENRVHAAINPSDLSTIKLVNWSLIEIFHSLDVEFLLEKKLNPGFYVLDYKFKHFKSLMNAISRVLSESPFIIRLRLPDGLYVYRLNANFKADAYYAIKLSNALAIKKTIMREIIENKDRYLNSTFQPTEKTASGGYQIFSSLMRSEVKFRKILPAPSRGNCNLPSLIFYPVLRPNSKAQLGQQSTNGRKKRKAPGDAPSKVKLKACQRDTAESSRCMRIEYLLNPK